MRLLLVGALLLATTASQAAAQITVNSTPAIASGDPGFAGESLIVDFDNPTPAGITLSGSYTIGAGLVSGFRAPPFGVTNNYFATPNVAGASSGTATIDFSGYLGSLRVNSLSFYWGSIDTYNTLDVLGVGGTVLASIGGSSVINPADGNQFSGATNRRLFLTFAGDDALDFRALRFTSNGRAFEIDNIAGSFAERATVPEPATASMLAFGLAVLGAAGARRKRTARSIA